MQTEAWRAEVEILQQVLVGREGVLFLEFNIPRMGKRVDAVLILAQVIFVVEFKVGEIAFERSATEQVWDYALDLANFHEGSHGVPIVPMLVATGARAKPLRCIEGSNRVYDPMHVTADQFRAAIDFAKNTKKTSGFTRVTPLKYRVGDASLLVTLELVA
jgi:hypothetical protein